MSKRRKNAGLGYGYQFHGAFKEKKDAVAKERKTKGAWIKGTFTKQGWRYIVMSPRTNPIKRKKKEPRVSSNPMDLVVMGANPGAREIVVQPGERITFRVNPSVLANPVTCGAMIGGYPCTRKPGHRGPHLPQGATLRPRSRHAWGPRGNPSAEAIREEFTGMPVDRVSIFREPHMPDGDYALVGKLLALYVKPLSGGQVQMIKAEGGTLVVSDESARRIWFVGGDQDISVALPIFGAIERSPGLFEIGTARRLDYKQRKEHVPEPDVDEWRHELGEETGVRPTVLFDANAKRLLFEGGDYRIERAGIIN